MMMSMTRDTSAWNSKVSPAGVASALASDSAVERSTGAGRWRLEEVVHLDWATGATLALLEETEAGMGRKALAPRPMASASATTREVEGVGAISNHTRARARAHLVSEESESCRVVVSGRLGFDRKEHCPRRAHTNTRI